MKWDGLISENVEAIMKFKGARLTTPKILCRCNYGMNANEIVEREKGAHLTQNLKDYEAETGKDRKQGALTRKGLANEITNDGYLLETKRYAAKVKPMPREATHYIDVTCPRCQTPLGRLEVTLRPVNNNPPEILTKLELANMKTSPEMMAFVSKRMNFGSVAQLEEWLSDADSEKGKAILRDADAKLRELQLPYEVTRITAALQAQIIEIDTEVKRRKVEFVNAIEKVVDERVTVIK